MRHVDLEQPEARSVRPGRGLRHRPAISASSRTVRACAAPVARGERQVRGGDRGPAAVRGVQRPAAELRQEQEIHF